MATKKQTFGLLVGNRGFFPDILAKEGHETLTKLLTKLGYGVVVLSPKDTKFGAVETWSDAKQRDAAQCHAVLRDATDRPTGHPKP